MTQHTRSHRSALRPSASPVPEVRPPGAPAPRAVAPLKREPRLQESLQMPAVALKDTRLVYRACSREFASLLGLAGPDQVIGRTDFELFPVELARQQQQYDHQSMRQTKPHVSQLLLGTGQRVLLSRTPVVNRHQQLRGVDIRLKPAHTEAGTLAPDNDSRGLPESGLQGSIVLRQGVPVFANLTAARMLGYPSVGALLEGTSSGQLFARGEWQRVQRQIASATAVPGQQPRPFRLNALTAGGQSLSLMAVARELSWQGGTALLVSFVDTGMLLETDQVNQPSLSEQRFQHYARASADFFWELDAELRFSHVSDELETIFGVPSDSVLGKTHEGLLESDGNINDEEWWSPQLERLRKHQPFRDFEFQWTIDNNVKRIRYSGIPIYDTEHRFVGYRGTGRDVTAVTREAESVAYHANHDALTGLLNRRRFELLCDRALRKTDSERASHVLFFMDLDSFKIVNDTCGHLAGDELLRQLADLFNSLIRKSDVLGRLGGDEFGVFLYNCSVAEALKLANQIRSEVENFQFLWEGNRFQVGISIGLVVVDDRWNSLQALFSAADSACYLAKDEGRNRVVVYREGDGHSSNRKVETHWVEEINAALADDRLMIARQEIQPVSQPREGSRFEIFTRLKAVNGDIINPRAFLPSAERYGLSARLDAAVIDLTLDWLRRHPRLLHTVRLCSINLTSSSFANPDFADDLIATIRDSGVPSTRLCFELTETATIANLSAASEFMHRLHDIGCHFMLDDFGSGLSSFAYLKKLPIEYLKIDGRLIKDILDDPIDFTMVKAINEISQSLGLLTVAKYVASPDLLEAVREIGVDYVQGYQIGKPEIIDR